MKLTRYLLVLALTAFLPALVLAQAAPAPAQQPAAQQPAGQQPAGEAQKKQITDPAEYNAYVAALQETNPGRKVQLLDEFITKYPNTVMKEEVLELKMVSQIQAGQNPEATARQLVQVAPNNLRGLIILANIFTTTPLQETDPQLQQKLSDGQMMAERGLKALPQFNPQGVSPEDLKKTKAAAEAAFRQALGVVAMGRKQYEVAQQEYKKAAELSPDDATAHYRLGNSYVSERPDPKYALAFWHFARAASLDGPAALPPAGREQVNNYLRDIYNRYHGSTEGLEELKQQAKAQPFPPADFKVMSKAEVAAAAPVEPEKMQFDEIKTMMVSGGPKSEELWGKLKGMRLKLHGMVLSVAPAARPRTVRLAVMADSAKKGEPDIELTLAAPTTAARVPEGKVVEFEGMVNEKKDEPFVLVLVDGKIAGAEAPPAAKKPAAKKGRKR